MMKHGLKGRPGQIYNCDESGMLLQHKVPKIISAKECKKVSQVSSGNKTQNCYSRSIVPVLLTK